MFPVIPLRLHWLLILALGCGPLCSIGSASTLFVSTGSGPTGDGSSWGQAFLDLNTALIGAASGDEIWVAQGTYVPGLNESDSFNLVEGVSIYGGFAGNEQARDDRNPSLNLCFLSGEIGAAEPFDNSFHVIRAQGVTEIARLDGFIVMGGNADGPIADSVGGGMLCVSSNPTLANCQFVDNVSQGSGAGVFYQGPDNGRPWSIYNTAFVRNQVMGQGASGGGVNSQEAHLNLVNCLFAENTGAVSGGGATLGLGTTLNCTFWGNQAIQSGLGQGGGVLLMSPDSLVANSIFWENEADGSDSDVGNPGSGRVIACDIGELSAGLQGDGNFSRDPLFANPAQGGFELLAGSPCIDSGSHGTEPGPGLPPDNVFLPPDLVDLDGDGDTAEPVPFDFLWNPRIVDDPNSVEFGQGPILDRGAFEFQPSFLQTPHGLRAGPGIGSIRLVWFPSAEPHLAGYNIYRAPSIGGPFNQPLNGAEPLIQPFYLDEGAPGDPLDGGKTYFYQLEAVSVTGEASLRSDTLAATEGAFSLEIPDRQQSSGSSNLLIPITTLNARGITAGTIVVDLPPTGLLFQTVEIPPLTQGASVTVDSDTSEVRIGFSGSTLNGEGHLFDLNFNVPATATLGDHGVLSIGRADLVGTPNVDFRAEGLFRVLDDFELGNINRDSDGVNDEDVLLAQDAALGTIALKPDAYSAADVNADGVMDVADVILVDRIGKGLSVNPPLQKSPGDKGGSASYSIEAATGFMETGSSRDLAIKIAFPQAMTSPGIAGLGLTVRFDPTLVQVEDVQKTPLSMTSNLVVLCASFARSCTAGVLNMILHSETEIPPIDGDWVRVTFKDIAPVPPTDGTETPVRLANVRMSTEFGENPAWNSPLFTVDGKIIYGQEPASPTPTSTPMSTPTSTPTVIGTPTPTPTPLPLDPHILLGLLKDIQDGGATVNDVLERVPGWLD